VYDTVRAGARIGGGCNATGNDVVPALGWSIPALAPGEEAWVGALTRLDGSEATEWGAGSTPTEWLAAERDAWARTHAESTPPSGLTVDEEALYRQSLAFLLMAQVQETGAPRGQVPASLPLAASVGDFHHIWNITWVRDGAYAAAALARAGFPARALESLAFMVQPGATGEWEAYVGGPHALSVCRIYGDGSEWTDLDENGPNIEFDGFGLWLWALGETRDSGAELPDALVDTALGGVADVIVRLVDPNTGLLQPDSSIWERHWNGHQEQFTYTNAWAVAGLDVAAELAEVRGEADRAALYRETSARIADAMAVELVDGSGILAASREQRLVGGDHLDLAAVEAFNVGALDPRGPVFDATLDAWDQGLRVASGHGYMRNDDGSVYDSHEWMVMDLRLAEALRRSCRPERADALEAWVRDTARWNDDIVPELLQPELGDFAGPAPMLGFGAGAWMLALHRRDMADAACADARALEENLPEELGCACSSLPSDAPWPGAPGGAGIVAALAAHAALRRRPRSHRPAGSSS
jgi:GH15 family glucan-1,4-alpha-glucosidase